ncbi:hypothetical protein RND71_001743 [Anisodus tanguticus]|uniref:RNase H type-1 domain-containing protein n=1 Tax=Anisodus tanguticus TaxID=243964 RepID=A0AAE1T349_9SOLA|nr:hypothetical protein RND71_001743 [Anisodus tanguticus]
MKAIYGYSHVVRVTKVIWKSPESKWVKVNTDGASRENPGKSSWGFCMRDSNEDIIQAQAKEIEEDPSTNTQAEAIAPLRYVETIQMDRIWIETDSLLIKNIVERVWEVPWKIITIIKEI